MTHRIKFSADGLDFCHLRVFRPSSLFYRALCGPCVQTSASRSNNSAPKEMAVGARRQINAATSELLTKVKGILILTAADGEFGATPPHKSTLPFVL